MVVVVVVKGGDLARIEAKKHLMGGRDEGLVSSVSLKERGEVGSGQCAVRSAQWAPMEKQEAWVGGRFSCEGGQTSGARRACRAWRILMIWTGRLL